MTKSNARGSHTKSRSKSKVTTDETKSTKTASATSSGFGALAFENGVLDPPNSNPPTNLAERQARLNRSRETASPPETAYRAYVHAVQTAPNEDSMVHISAKLLKDFDDDLRYAKVYNQGFNSFPPNVGFNNGLSVPEPDLVEALQRPAFRPFPVKAELGGAAVLIDDPDSMTLPHLAGEWKGRGKDMEEARTQSAYDGAALVYGRNQALAYMNAPDPPGYASVSTFTLDGTNINFFSHYAASSEVEDGRVDYHQYPLTSTNLVNSFDEFKRGRKQLRNLPEDARNESYALRDQLVDHWKQRQGFSGPSGDTQAMGFVPQCSLADDAQYALAPLSGEPDTTQLPVADSDRLDGESEYEIVETPTVRPTPPASVSKQRDSRSGIRQKIRSSAPSSHSSKSRSPPLDHAPSGTAKKRKSSSYRLDKANFGED